LQIHAYFIACPEIPLWSLVYDNKDDNEWKEFVIKRDDDLLTEVKSEINELKEHVRSKDLPPILEECSQKKGRYKTCEFAHSCLDISEWPQPPRKVRKPK
jgi:hypothetical protein